MPEPDSIRILIVDDDPASAAFERRALEGAGYEVVPAESVPQAIAIIRAGPVHLVLLDNRPAGHPTGVDFLATLRTAAPEIPVILVAGEGIVAAEGAVMHALRGGARDFIRKDKHYLEHLPQAVAGVLRNGALEAQLQGVGSATALALLLVHANGAAPETDRQALENSGFRVFTAGDRDQALDVLGRQDILLLVIDDRDGGAGGVEIYRHIREAGHDVRAVLVSSGADEGVLIEAIRAGFIDFVPKNGDYPLSLCHAVHRVAERLRLEAQLAESRTLLAGIVNSVMEAILLVDDQRCIRMFNPAAERIFQVPSAEAVRRGIAEFIPALGERLSAPDAMEGPASHMEARGIRQRANHGSADAELELELALAPLQAGGRRFLTVIARDVTQPKELERRLLQKDKLESLGLLAGGIAHDFNNLLVGIMGNSSLALETISSNNPARPVLKDVILASETAANLTRQLLAYAGKGRFVIEPVDLSDLVRQISTLVQTSIPRSVQLRMELMDRLPCVEADVTQMQQVIMNLVMNAAEAIGEDQGTVLITTGVQHVDEDYIATVLVPAQISPGEYVSLQVHDTGTGMTQETMDRIFDPFFTTKFTGRGLGLAAALGIVRGHKGAIKVYSTLGQGTTFKLLFPATEQQAAATPHPLPPQATMGETVLVVDDEQIVRRSAKAMLERHGYSVVLAENGKEAVDLYHVLADKIDLVLLDMTMPVMGGEETFRELKTIRADVRVILSSGYNEVEAVRRFAGKGLAGFLQKPYSALTLTEKVRAVLSESRGTAQS